MPSKSSIIEGIESLNKQINEHESNIKNHPKSSALNHWQGELREFKAKRDKLRSQLNDGEYEVRCPNPKCAKLIIRRKGVCPKCGTYISS